MNNDLRLAKQNAETLADMRDNAWLNQYQHRGGNATTRPMLRHQALKHAARLAEAEVKRLEQAP